MTLPNLTQPTKSSASKGISMNDHDTYKAYWYIESGRTPQTNHGMHLLMSICTLGAWLVVWLFAANATAQEKINMEILSAKIRDEELEKCSTI